MGSRRFLPSIAACGVVLVALLGGGLGTAARGQDEPPGAPRMPAGGRAAQPGTGSAAGTPPVSGAITGDVAAAAKAGDPEAQLKFGLALLAAKPPNVVEGLKWLRMSSDHGNAIAAYTIGLLYANGNPKNLVEAAKWYRIAAERSNSAAQNSLGVLYDNGQGVPQDFAEALKWYRLAADQRNAAGQNNLGALYAKGNGVPADQVEAVRLFRLAANQGYAIGQANLGLQYQAGRGTGMNDSAAYFWLNLAAAALPGNLTAIRDQVARARDAVSHKLAPAELERIQRLAVAWKPGSLDVPPDVAGAGGPQTAGVAARPPGVAGVPGTLRGSGTGFVITPGGFVVTNNHVAGECTEVRARHGGDQLGALSVVAKDAQNDLALLKLAARFPDAAMFREDRGLRQGDNVVVYGFPLGGMLTTQGNLTTGTISALSGLGNDSRMLQVSAPIQPGNSGGPLLDAGGNVIGVVASQLRALPAAQAIGVIPQNVNFAIKSGVVRNFLDANGVEYRTTAETRDMKTADVADRAKKFTLFIECWR